MKSLDPKIVALIKHIILLFVLGALSTGLVPAYDALSLALTHVTPTLPLFAQSALSLLLPVMGAAVVKFKDEVTQEFQDEQNKQLAAKNIVLTEKTALLEKSLNVTSLSPETTHE